MYNNSTNSLGICPCADFRTGMLKMCLKMLEMTLAARFKIYQTESKQWGKKQSEQQQAQGLEGTIEIFIAFNSSVKSHD